MTKYAYTTQKQIREAFWREHPGAERRKIANYSGNGTMHVTDTRCAFTDYLDWLSKSGMISQDLAQRARDILATKAAWSQTAIKNYENRA